MTRHQLGRWLLAVAGSMVLLCGCTPDDADRCRSGWVYEGGDCLLIEEDTGTASSSDQGTDSSTVTDELPSGLGDTCGDDDDCAGKDASYCAFEMGETEVGTCNISDCLDGTNVCPASLGLVCCAFSKIDSYPSMCLPQKTYDEFKNTVGC